MATKIQLRRDTAANWSSNNPTLSQGEAGFAYDTNTLKIGDGINAWNALAAVAGGGGGGTGGTLVGPISITTSSATTIATITAGTTNRSVEVLIQVTQGTKYTVSKVLMIHNGTTTTMTEYGIIELGASRIPLTLSATYSGGSMLLQATVTDAGTTNAQVRALYNVLAI